MNNVVIEKMLTIDETGMPLLYFEAGEIIPIGKML